MAQAVLLLIFYFLFFPQKKKQKSSWRRIFEIGDSTKDEFLHTSNIRMPHVMLNEDVCNTHDLSVCDTYLRATQRGQPLLDVDSSDQHCDCYIHSALQPDRR